MFFAILVIATFITFAIALSTAIFWPRIRETGKVFRQTVSVLIPARNEEENLPKCLDSLLVQRDSILEILVYDDHSNDGTLSLIQTYAAKHSFLKLVPASSLPAGWCGKNFACAQLAQAAKGEWLLLLDADTRLSPNTINRILAEAHTRQLSFLSCWPRFGMQTFVEKLLMPMLNFVVFSIYPSFLSFARNPQLRFNPRLGLAHGACMLFERASYEAFGGHEKVKGQIFEDTRFAQMWRASGRNGLCLDGQDVVQLRMYSSWREIWFGFQKNFYPAFTHSPTFWSFLLLHLVLFFLPFIGAVLLQTPLIIVGAVFVWLTRVVLAVRFRQPLLSTFFHPVAEGILLCLGISSWWKYRTGQGVAWKGRVYPRGA